MQDVKQITTAQEVFDYVANHLIKQGKAAINEESGCAYRGENGSSCAVGCLILDEEYDEDFEGERVADVIRMSQGKPLFDRLSRHLALLKDLQTVHDDVLRYNPDDLRDALSETAYRHKLKVNFQ